MSASCCCACSHSQVSLDEVVLLSPVLQEEPVAHVVDANVGQHVDVVGGVEGHATAGKHSG